MTTSKNYFNLDTGYGVNADQVIRVSSEKGGSISRPLKTGAVRGTGLGAGLIEVSRSQGVNDNLALQIPDLDLLVSGSTQPVTVGGEAEGVDDLTSIK
mmetsp:Transcript_1624/g.2188  ORF Transcript_1624/g.2188 Transcript_1624/m.2188 type:complete len:98 (+) Transcript_1624:44-337(+)